MGGARTAAYVGLVMANMLPFPVTAIAADLGANMLEDSMPPELVTARKYLGYASLASAGVFVAKMGYSMIKTAVQYAAKRGSKAASRGTGAMSSSLSKRADEIAERKKNAPHGSCPIGCFTAGTLVWAATGRVAPGFGRWHHI
ncbi:MAG: hypothetical protein GIKADHBN_01568 [Phycisphaerales bacterium]|nr:hypothetical protein [Phycisphaerales bacterium]